MDIKKTLLFAQLMLLASLTMAGVIKADEAVSSAASGKYRLVVVLVIDQMRSDYFTRYGHQFTGGLARLQNDGAVFLNGYHEHSATATAVGHATIATGLLPKHHGIVGNWWYDRDKGRRVYASEDSSETVLGHPAVAGQSPKNLLRPTIGDLIKVINPASKVVAVALKDRSATIMGGLQPDAVFWLDFKSGDFVTSTYYMKSVPYFVDSFNNSGYVRQLIKQKWVRLLSDSAYNNLEPATSIAAHAGREKTFPHSFVSQDTASDRENYEALFDSPFGDLATIQFARQAIAEYQMGQDLQPDIFWLGCSSADAIGHSFGPNSDEVQDYYLRLDKYLADFFIFLDSLCGKENYLTILTSDHGVMPLPEYLQAQGIKSQRLSADSLKRSVLAIGDKIAKKYNALGNLLRFEGSNILINFDSLPHNQTSPGALENELAIEIRKLDFVADVYTRSELSKGNCAREYSRLFENNYYPTRSGDLAVRLNENILNIGDSVGTTHMTPYKYDTQVPVVFFGYNIMPRAYADSIRTVDLAPTIFELLGYTASEKFDGRSLKRIISKQEE